MDTDNETVVDELLERTQLEAIATEQTPKNWPLCDPSFVLEMLHALKAEACFEKKPYFSTYSKSWVKLTADRRMKTIKFFEKQSAGVQSAIAVGAMALEQAKAAIDSERSENTTKDDRCR